MYTAVSIYPGGSSAPFVQCVYAIGIQDLKENKEVTYTNQRIVKKNSDDIKNTLIKETNMLSSVTADIFKCDSNI